RRVAAQSKDDEDEGHGQDEHDQGAGDARENEGRHCTISIRGAAAADGPIARGNSSARWQATCWPPTVRNSGVCVAHRLMAKGQRARKAHPRDTWPISSSPLIDGSMFLTFGSIVGTEASRARV